jgi:hypothetical protein
MRRAVEVRKDVVAVLVVDVGDLRGRNLRLLIVGCVEAHKTYIKPSGTPADVILSSAKTPIRPSNALAIFIAPVVSGHRTRAYDHQTVCATGISCRWHGQRWMSAPKMAAQSPLLDEPLGRGQS